MEYNWRDLGAVIDSHMYSGQWIICENDHLPNIMIPRDPYSPFIGKHISLDGPYPIKLEPIHFFYKWRIDGE